MSKLTALADFKNKFDIELEKYLDNIIKETDKNGDLFMLEMVKYIKKMVLAGGKRLRPALMYYGYLSAGGKNKKNILKAAIGIELVHIYFLIHDDIMDKDEKRHGLETFQYRYEKIAKKLNKNGDAQHFGNSMAILAGNIACVLGSRAICESGFEKKLIIEALAKMQSIIMTTIIGQSQDVLLEYKKRSDEKEILEMYKNKTAKYTISGPLQMGAILGGANDNFIKSLNKFAIPTGIAFQIKDDILGIFSSEKELGKKIGSDISGEKQILFVVMAKELANKGQKEILNSIQGSQKLSAKTIQDFKKVIIDTGALEYSEKLAVKLIAEAKKELAGTKMDKEAKTFLNDIADYMIQWEL